MKWSLPVLVLLVIAGPWETSAPRLEAIAAPPAPERLWFSELPPPGTPVVPAPPARQAVVARDGTPLVTIAAVGLHCDIAGATPAVRAEFRVSDRPSHGQLAVIDINNDGRVDVVTTSIYEDASNQSRVEAWQATPGTTGTYAKTWSNRDPFGPVPITSLDVAARFLFGLDRQSPPSMPA